MALRPKSNPARKNLQSRVSDLEKAKRDPYLYVTYYELVQLKDDNELIAGQLYAFEHTSYHLIDNSGGVESDNTIPAETETFVVLATSISSLSPDIASIEHPDDDITYTTDSTAWGDLMSERTMGKVLYRSGLTDDLQRVTARFDWRRCIYRTWHADLTSIFSDASMDDEPCLWAESVTIGKTPTTYGKHTITSNGNFTDSKFAILEQLQNPTFLTPPIIELGNYEQQVVCLPQRSKPTSTYVVSGDFTKSINIRTQNSTSCATDADFSSNGERSVKIPTINGFISCPYVATANMNQFSQLRSSELIDTISFFPVDRFFGDTMVNCTAIPRKSSSFFYTYFNVHAEGMVRSCLFDGSVSNGYFVATEGLPVIEQCMNMDFYGFDAVDLICEVEAVNNQDLTNSAIVPKTTADIIVNDVYDSNFFTTAQNPSANVLTLSTALSFNGIITSEGTMTTFTRSTLYRHDVTLVATGAGLTINAGGNIINASGTTYASGDRVILKEVAKDTFMIIAEM